MGRKSLLIGINYTGSQSQLNGCINDVHNVQRWLTSVGFPPDPNSMLVLTDDQQDPRLRPTRENMINAFRWLVGGTQPGDSLFLHYSGHGGTVKDVSNDEASGHDSTLIPVDYESAGQIIDDELYEVLVKPLPQGVKMHAILDCCHSGTIFDLPFSYRPNADGKITLSEFATKARQLLADWNQFTGAKDTGSRMKAGMNMFTQGKSLFNAVSHRNGAGEEWEQASRTQGPHGAVYCFSGCKDNQTSADATIAGQASGAMSWGLLTTLQQQPQQTYAQLLQNTRQLLLGKYTQVPQLAVGAQTSMDIPMVL
ncbi:hypothetical protein WJX74_008370 [Apatococcus lobatus]|uniref:Peptidase C14 caspase domain-containing protein n=1 Tax=Apatococcus lobatus TaxID=904363 RepID=A0AAW1QAN7_9CHLO